MFHSLLFAGGDEIILLIHGSRRFLVFSCVNGISIFEVIYHWTIWSSYCLNMALNLVYQILCGFMTRTISNQIESSLMFWNGSNNGTEQWPRGPSSTMISWRNGITKSWRNRIGRKRYWKIAWLGENRACGFFKFVGENYDILNNLWNRLQ